MKIHLKIATIALLASTMPMAQAGYIEDLLAVPAIQSLLGRQPELQATLQKCGDWRYRQRNARFCQQAEEAGRLTRMPPELRAVLSNPPAAASIRELCLVAQGTRVQHSYLCTELSRADVSFTARVEQQRQATEAAQRQTNQDAQLGK